MNSKSFTSNTHIKSQNYRKMVVIYESHDLEKDIYC